MNDQNPAMHRMDGGIVSLQISTDDNPYMDGSFVARLASVVEELKGDQSVRAVVIEGGTRYFSAGASREALVAADPQVATIPWIAEIPRLVLSLPMPTVAAMSGHAIGGGFLIGLWCDIAVLAEESLYGINAAALGITPVMGSTMILEQALGAALARELLYTGRIVKGLEIKQWYTPLSHAVVPRANVRERALAIAQEIADVPREPVALFKQALSRKRRAALEQALEIENGMYQDLLCETGALPLIAERYPVSYSQSGPSET